MGKEGTGKGQGKVVSVVPDICLTPVGPAQVPVPYPVVASFEESEKTSPNVTFAGKPAFLKDQSLIPYTMGDQAGFCGGIRSKTCGGVVEAIQGSSTVYVNGKPVVRHGDLFKMNNGNTIGKAIILSGPSHRGAIDASGKISVDTNPPAEAKTPEEKRFAEKVGEWWDKTKSQVGEAKEHPVEGVKGAAKDTANLVPDTGELVARGESLEGAQEQSDTANWLRLFGNKQAAEKLEGSAEEMRQNAQRVHLDHFDLSNAAQEGGAKVALGLQILIGAAGLVKEGWEGIRAVSKMVGRETGPEVKLLNAGTKLEKVAVKETEAAPKADVLEKAPEVTEKPATSKDGIRVMKPFSLLDAIDETTIDGWKADRIRPGIDKKIAVIGRPMDAVEKYKTALAKKLDGQGYEIEIFQGQTVPRDAEEEFAELKRNRKRLTDAEIPDSVMYRRNKEWATKLKDQGYTVVDIGDPLGKENEGESLFYKIERKILFNDK